MIHCFLLNVASISTKVFKLGTSVISRRFNGTKIHICVTVKNWVQTQGVTAFLLGHPEAHSLWFSTALLCITLHYCTGTVNSVR
jgi:hypothetical protein